MLKQIRIISILLLLTYSLHSQKHSVVFEQISTDQGLPNSKVYSIAQDHNGFIWIGTVEGLVKYDGRNFKLYQNNPEDSTSIPVSLITEIQPMADNSLWLATRGMGIIRFDMITEKFTHFVHAKNDSNSIPFDNIEKFYVDRDSSLWGTEDFRNGFYFAKSGRFIQSKLPNEIIDQNIKIENIVKTIGDAYDFSVTPDEICYAQFDKNSILVSARQNGAFLYNTNTNTFDKLTNGFFKEATDIGCITKDKSNTIWIAKFNDGALFYSPLKINFQNYLKFKNNKYSIDNLFVRSLNKDASGNVWIATQTKGLLKFSPVTSDFEVFTQGNYKNGDIYSNKVRCIFFAKDSSMWIGTQGAFAKYLPSKNSFHTYKVYDENNKQRDSRIYSIIEDNDSSFWMANWDNVVKFNKYSHQIKYYSKKMFNMDNIQHIMRDQNGNLWISAEFGGIVVFDTKQNKIIQRYCDVGVSSKQNVFMTLQQNDSIVWAATSNGLFKINTYRQKINVFTEKDGLPTNNTLGLVFDEENNLWITTTKGLACLNLISNNITSFYKTDGLQSDEFVEGAHFYDSRKKEILVGGIKGFNIFKPSLLHVDSSLTIPQITTLKVLNKVITPNKVDTQSCILNNPIEFTDKITLHNKDKVFTFKIAALNFARYKYNQLAYQLVGFDDKEIVVDGPTSDVTYTNLSPGKYVFSVRASNGYGIWNTTPRILNITIVPTFYQTIWFKILIALAILSLLVFIYLYRIKSIKKHKEQLEMEVRERTLQLHEINTELEEKKEEIQVQKEMLEIKNEELENHKLGLEFLIEERTAQLMEAKVNAEKANSLKTAFLQNMSHEIRTPMNAIIGFSDLIAEASLNSVERNEYFEIIKSNGQALLHIIDDVLDISRIQAGTLEIHKEKFNSTLLYNDIAASIKMIITPEKSNKIDFIYNKNIEDIEIYSDYFRCKQIITNLLVNAFKYTIEGFVQFDFAINNDSFCFIVKDSGSGIKEEDISRIFDRFEKISYSNKSKERGVGLGLAISKQLATLLNGDILVKSTYEVGSEFTFVIPKC